MSLGELLEFLAWTRGGGERTMPEMPPAKMRLQDLLQGKLVPNQNIRPPTAPMIGIRG